MLSNSFGPHLIDFYDLPLCAPSDRTPQIIGRLTDAGAAICDALPTGEAFVHLDSQADYAIKKAFRLHAWPLAPLALLARTLSSQAQRSHAPLYAPYLELDIRDRHTIGDTRPRLPEWHRDGCAENAHCVSYIIGDAEARHNTEYATIDIPDDLLPLGHIPSYSPANKQVTAFLENNNAIAQIGSNEILKLFGDTPHRSSRTDKSGWRFVHYTFG